MPIMGFFETPGTCFSSTSTAWESFNSSPTVVSIVYAIFLISLILEIVSYMDILLNWLPSNPLLEGRPCKIILQAGAHGCIAKFATDQSRRVAPTIYEIKLFKIKFIAFS
jgi:hypothetical protein